MFLAILASFFKCTYGQEDNKINIPVYVCNLRMYALADMTNYYRKVSYFGWVSYSSVVNM